MSLDLREAASRLLDSGYTKDEVIQVINGVKEEAVSMRQQGLAIPEIEKKLSASRFRDKSSGAHIALFEAPQQEEKPGLISNLAEQYRAGARALINPSSVQFPGSETLGQYSETARNMISRLLGLGQVGYAVPNALARTYVGDPMRSAGLDVRFPIGDPGTAIARETPIPGGVTPTAPSIGLADIAEAAASTGASLLGGPIATSTRLPGAVRMLGRLLDPLSGLQRTSSSAQAALQTRSKAIEDATAAMTRAKEQLRQVEQFGTMTPAANEARLAADTAQQQLESLTKKIPVKPVEPAASQRLRGLVTPSEEAATTGMAAGQQFKTTKAEATRNLFAQSSQNYDDILQQYGNIGIDKSGIDSISSAVSDMAESMRATTATKAVGQKLSRTTDIEGYAGLGENALRQIQQHIADTGALTVSDAINMKQRLQAQNNVTKDLSVINANRHVMGAIDDALGRVAGPAGEALQQAAGFHRYVHGVVGPRSLAEKAFKVAPENVIDRIFLPEGKAPNISAIRNAKEVFLKSDNPEAWLQITDGALAKFGQRIVNPNTGAFDLQRFNRQFNAYESAFREALPAEQFQALKDFRNSVQSFNAQSAEFRAAQRQVAQQQRTVTALRGEQAAAENISPAMRAARGGVKTAAEELKAATGSSQTGVAQQFMSPYTMLALAQVGQALQASFTGNWVGVGRQLSQGVVWYTLGNPQFLQKMISSPTLSRALSVVASRAQVPAARLGNAAKILSDAIYQDQGSQ